MAESGRRVGVTPVDRNHLRAFLQEPFGTFGLLLMDWAIVVALAFSVFPVLELAKWIGRRGWLGIIH
jgi:hypothetical protein